MRDENLQLIENNMFLPEESRKPLTESQCKLLEEVTDCYHLQLQKPMISRASLRDYLINKYKLTKTQAYRVIQYAAVILGNVQPTHKNFIRQRVEFLSEKAYEAIVATDYRRADALTKLAKVLAKAFATNIDEGELINAQKYLDEEPITLTIDPSALKIKTSEAKQKEIERMLRKYEIEDAEIVTEVED